MQNRDYSQSVIYFIRHKINNELPFYIGSAYDFEYRQGNHISKCYNITDRDHNLQVYKFIRQNGGWDEWQMIIHEKYPLHLETNEENQLALEIREQYWIDFYDNINNGLNTIRAHTNNEIKKEQQRICKKKRKENMTEKEKKEYKEKQKEWNQTEKAKEGAQRREKERNEKIRNDTELLDKKRKQSRESAAKPWTCIICNITINRGGRCRHLKTQSHLDKAANSVNNE